MLTLKDARGIVFLTNEYDANGRVTRQTQADSMSGTSEAVTTSFTYESTFNQVASVTDPLNHTTSFAYDSKGRLTTLTDPLNNQTTFAYNSAAQPISVTNPLNKTTQFAYDFGDLASLTDALSRTTNFFADSAGRRTAVIDPLSNTTRYEYDSLNRLTRITDSLGGATVFSYDANGNLLTVTDARNGVTAYTYNNMDRVTSRQDPLLRKLNIPMSHLERRRSLVRPVRIRFSSRDARRMVTAFISIGPGTIALLSRDLLARIR